MRARFWLLAILAVLTIILLAGCSRGSNAGGSSQSDRADGESEAAATESLSGHAVFITAREDGSAKLSTTDLAGENKKDLLDVAELWNEVQFEPAADKPFVWALWRGSGRAWFKIIDCETGKVSDIEPEWTQKSPFDSPLWVTAPTFSSDGNMVYYVRFKTVKSKETPGASSQSPELVAYSVQDGHKQTIFSPQWMNPEALSILLTPDGRKVALAGGVLKPGETLSGFTKTNAVAVMGPDGADAKITEGLPEAAVYFSVDGKVLYLANDSIVDVGADNSVSNQRRVEPGEGYFTFPGATPIFSGSYVVANQGTALYRPTASGLELVNDFAESLSWASGVSGGGYGYHPSGAAVALVTQDEGNEEAFLVDVAGTKTRLTNDFDRQYHVRCGNW